MPRKAKNPCLSCHEDIEVKKSKHGSGVFSDYSESNMEFFSKPAQELSDLQKFDKDTMCDRCYDSVHENDM